MIKPLWLRNIIALFLSNLSMAFLLFMADLNNGFSLVAVIFSIYCVFIFILSLFGLLSGR